MARRGRERLEQGFWVVVFPEGTRVAPGAAREYHPGGAWLAVLTSLYLGYHPETGPVSFIIGTSYALISGAVAGAIFGWLDNLFVEKL